METSTHLKYAVVGSGALGGYYGGKLAAAGCRVHFLMRRDLEHVRRHGLVICEKTETLFLEKVRAHGSTEEIGPCDVVLIALKTTSNSALETLLPPLLKKNTLLVTLQNGLGNEAFLAKRFGAGRVLGGLCFVCLNRVAPGVIEHYGHGTLSIGEYRGAPRPRTLALAGAFQSAGVETRAVENLAAERWRKLVWNIPFNGLSIAAGCVTVDQILADDGLRALARDLMAEVIGAAKKLGHKIPVRFIDRQIERTIPMGPYKPSSLVDFIAGREVEVESIWGEPCRRALRAGAKVPRMEMLYFLLRKMNGENLRPTPPAP
jgi:2-dehydropantoate 2-reductase